MVGAGAQAHPQISAIAAVRPSIRRVLIWNRTLVKAQALARRLVKEGIAAEVFRELAPAIREAAIVSMATATREPLLEGAYLSPGAISILWGPLRRECANATTKRSAAPAYLLTAVVSRLRRTGAPRHPNRGSPDQPRRHSRRPFRPFTRTSQGAPFGGRNHAVQERRRRSSRLDDRGRDL